MIFALEQSHFKVDHREAGQWAAVHNGANTLFNTWDIFFRNRPANNARFERITFTWFRRRDGQLDLSILTRTTRLLLVGISVGDFMADGLTIGHLRRTDIGFDFKLTAHTIHKDIQVQLAHTFHDGLT